MTWLWAALIGAAATVFGAFIAAYLGARYARTTRRIRIYRGMSFPAILMGEIALTGKLQVTFDGRRVENIHSTHVEVTNVGKEAISDIPLEWSLETSGELLTVTSRGIPQAADTMIFDPQSKKVRVHLPFLNSGEMLELTAYASEPFGSHQVQARSPGVEIDSYDWKEAGRREIWAALKRTGLLIILGIIFATVSVFWREIWRWLTTAFTL